MGLCGKVEGLNRVHLNFEENQEFDAFWEWGMGNWEWKKESFCKYEMLPNFFTHNNAFVKIKNADELCTIALSTPSLGLPTSTFP